ncbi:hypothetical protein Tco_1351584 [Tanacetum coccineum]
MAAVSSFKTKNPHQDKLENKGNHETVPVSKLLGRFALVSDVPHEFADFTKLHATELRFFPLCGSNERRCCARERSLLDISRRLATMDPPGDSHGANLTAKKVSRIFEVLVLFVLRYKKLTILSFIEESDILILMTIRLSLSMTS